jgi:hypothetical protein
MCAKSQKLGYVFFSLFHIENFGILRAFFSQGNPPFFCFYNILSQKLVGIQGVGKELGGS